jgi:hypothetical protein
VVRRDAVINRTEDLDGNVCEQKTLSMANS